MNGLETNADAPKVDYLDFDTGPTTRGASIEERFTSADATGPSGIRSSPTSFHPSGVCLK